MEISKFVGSDPPYNNFRSSSVIVAVVASVITRVVGMDGDPDTPLKVMA
jgi:hypothetical protein